MAKLHLLRHIAIALCVVMLSACGFQLKTASTLPEDLQNLQVTSVNSESKLYSQLNKSLTQSNIQTTSANQANAELKLLDDKLTRRTLSLFQNGQVAEHELIYSVSYQLFRKNKKTITLSFEVTRNYQDDPNNALGKSREMDLILSEMREQASNLIIRQLGQF